MERKDSWSSSDDNLLAEVVIKHIKDGSTQLKAFEEAAFQLGRTAGACGFRWNSTVRKLHENVLKESKISSKQKSISGYSKRSAEELEDKIPLTEIFSYIKELEQTVEQQRKEIEQLRKRYIANDELQALVKIVSQAKQNGFLNRAN